MTFYCPADDKPFETMEDLRGHLTKAKTEGDENHLDIIETEGWDETSAGLPVKKASDLEDT